MFNIFNKLKNVLGFYHKFSDEQKCYKEIQRVNKIIYPFWFWVMLLMDLSVILLSAYYILFVDGEAEIIGNYLYIVIYIFQIIFTALYLNIFNNEKMTLRKYDKKIDFFMVELIVWVLLVSIMDIYYTNSYSAFVGGAIEMSVLYFKPKKFSIMLLISTFVLFVAILVFNGATIETINTFFNLLILVGAIIFFDFIKYHTKISDILKTIQLQEISKKDALTGLYNRMSLTQYIENIENTNYDSIVVAMIDIDDFKKINDTYGHIAGDKCISCVGKNISDINKMGYRYGGEEFLIIFENQPFDIVCKMMEKFRKCIEETKISNIDLRVSIGISNVYNSHNIEKIIDEADNRLYKAKNTGKNKVVYE